MEEHIGVLNKHLKAHLFLEMLRLNDDKISQIITGAGNSYEYEALWDSVQHASPVSACSHGADKRRGDGAGV